MIPSACHMVSQRDWDHFQQEFGGIVLQGQMAKTWHQVKKQPAYGIDFLSSMWKLRESKRPGLTP